MFYLDDCNCYYCGTGRVHPSDHDVVLVEDVEDYIDCLECGHIEEVCVERTLSGV